MSIHERIANIRFKHTASWSVGKKMTVKSDIHKALDALEIAVRQLEHCRDVSVGLFSSKSAEALAKIEAELEP